MRVAVALAVILGVTVALPTQDVQVHNVLTPADIAPRNTALEQTLLDALESLREIMLTGSDDIPVLDPFELDHFHLELDSLGLYGSHVTAGDVNVEKLSTFEIEDLSLSLTTIFPPRYTLEIEGKIPVLEVEAGQYDLSVTVLNFNIFGNGRAKFSIIEPKIKGTFVVSAGIIGGINLNIVSADLGFELGGLKAELTGMFNDNVVDDFMGLFLENLVPEMVEFFEEDIREFLSAAVLEVGNNILADLDIGSIINPNNAQLPIDAPLESNPGIKV